ncbi:MAG: protein-L-isoaspartate(D-aspartate) O-methyltransferase [Planctomycetota bacterium]
MVDSIRRHYELTDERVLAAMAAVPRHWFVSDGYQRRAYIDSPLPIGHGQTISQPFIVAYMTHLLAPDENKKVLEVGTGLGYQAAVLSELVAQVYTIEIVKPLGEQAAENFQLHGYTNIHAKVGDGYKGWPRHAPFDGIIVTCAPDHIPPDLIEQLKPGGIMVIPVGGRYSVQELVVVTKNAEGKIHRESKLPVRFVPLTREKE